MRGIGPSQTTTESLPRSGREFVEFTGHAKLDKRTKHLVRRLSADDVAIIDHTDLDRVSAEELVESGVRVVVNVAPSQTGRFPNPGPLLLVRGGVRLIDAPGADLFDAVADGDLVTVRGASIFSNGDCVATGRILQAGELATALADQRGRVTEALQAFADNTMRYIRDFKPVLVGVDGGADAMLDAGYKPDVIVGDMDSVSDRALKSGAELLVHAYESGAAPGS